YRRMGLAPKGTVKSDDPFALKSYFQPFTLYKRDPRRAELQVRINGERAVASTFSQEAQDDLSYFAFGHVAAAKGGVVFAGHGIAPRVEGGLVELSTRNEGGILKIKVSDDGAGLKEGWRVEDAEGIGLANTVARLEQLYGEEHRFYIRNREEGAGVEAVLAFPFHLAENGHG
ncbi:MAG: hypothetical protein LC731_02865, partial [Acidobacteria bacterium]|nr:hypothetical protein [Acidobacteriota bacterium]